MDYRVMRTPTGLLRERISSRTWEFVPEFHGYKASTGTQPMKLLQTPDGVLWFLRVEFMKRSPLMRASKPNVAIIAEGTKAELWPLFLRYVEFMR